MPDKKPDPTPEPYAGTIESLLANKAFDRDGAVRSKLAALAVSGGPTQRPPLDLVDSDGNPVTMSACPTCGR
jgi:hypothetical protein